jgi:hypothetical protein
MNMNRNDTQEAIDSGTTVLDFEFGSTRIKAVLIGEDHTKPVPEFHVARSPGKVDDRRDGKSH